MCWEGGVETLQGRDFRAMRLSEIDRVVRAALIEVRLQTGN